MRQPQLCSMPASSCDPAHSSASTAFLLEHITETDPGTENQEQYGDEAEQETDEGVPGTPYLTAWANSGKSGREQALRLLSIRRACLEPLAFSASGRERMFNGPTAASGWGETH